MIRFFTRWCVVAVMVSFASTPAAWAQVALSSPNARPAVDPALRCQLHGVVRDDHGRPIPGAVVSALGSTTVFAVSDGQGRFAFRSLPAGSYLVRAHLQGYLPERGRVIQVTATEQTAWTIALTRRSAEKTPPPVLAAGVGPTDTATVSEATEDDHGEVAWRLRHAPRSVLKSGEQAIAGLDDQPAFIDDSLAGIGRAVGTPSRLASSLFADMSLNGQINLLTTASFDRPQDLFTTNVVAPHSVAFVSLTVPMANGDWTVRGSITEGDLASWIAAGSYKRNATADHRYEAGLTYATQRYLGGNSEALAAMRDGSRNVGAVYAYDNWRLAPRASVGFGARFASYDYLGDRGLFSPKASVTVKPSAVDDKLTLQATLSHREIAPGAEEFVPSAIGPWLPPERTFSSVSHGAFIPERLDHVELAAEREAAAGVLIGLRVFRQRVNDQMVALFGGGSPDATATVGHYQVGTAGDFDAHGWGVSVGRTLVGPLHASVDYTQVKARWTDRRPDAVSLSRVAPAALRDDERINDLTATVETVIAATATRVFAIYKISDGFAAAESSPSPLARFDVQVNQPLPFLNFSSAHWEMLLAVRTLFRDDPLDGSVYDELLVVRPPKRVLGGVTVRF
jgi:hypothetical protein